MASNVDHQGVTTATHEIDQLDLDVDTDTNSAFGGSNGRSETTSIASVCMGYFENGRRYQNIRNDEYHMPSDDKQWESMSAGHLLFLILDSQRENSLFRSRLAKNAQNVIDLGTGNGEWALAVADKFPNLTVRGVDLTAPPQIWTAPNCIFEVDDITRHPWTWSNKFDLVHMRHMLGAMNKQEWTALYRRVYDNLEPGGWIEQVEADIGIFCDDGSMPKDSLIATNFRQLFLDCGARADRPLDTIDTMRSGIEAAGFTSVQQQDYKQPIGSWPKQQVHKDAGWACKEQFLRGVEGYVMWFLTHDQRNPWTIDEVHVYLAKLKNEVNQGWHIYQRARRVWAQKPYETKATTA